MSPIHGSRRWLALYILCLGVFMIVLDTTIVNVALPSIRADLQFSETDLVWVVNAYFLTFGGCLLLGGRLGDLYGPKRLFLFGIVVFTLASAACGLSTARQPLIWARAAQGIGGAIVDSVSLALIMNMFTEPDERARAMGIYGFVCSAGGSIGVLLGGVLTASLSWHWIFLVNLPAGVIVFLLCLRLIPAPASGEHRTIPLDTVGAITLTVASVLAVYTIVNGNEVGWTSARTVGCLALAVSLLAIFVVIESRVKSPLVPLRVFRSRPIVIANIAAIFWATAIFAWFFICALYLQRVLGLDAMHVGLAFVPSNVVMAVLSIGVSARLVMRFGVRAPFVVGMLLAALGLALFAIAPAQGAVLRDVIPGMILMGLGAGIAFNPLLLAAMNGVPESESGLAAGLVNTSFMLGGSIGLAILASTAAARTDALSSMSGADPASALNGGYHIAFALGALCSIVAGVMGLMLTAPISYHSGQHTAEGRNDPAQANP